MKEDLLHRQDKETFQYTVLKRYKNYKAMLYFFLMGATLMFLSLTFMYFMSHLSTKETTLKMPVLFFVNTFILLASSIAVEVAQAHFRNDRYEPYKKSLLYILGLGTLFLVGQLYAWYLLFYSGQKFQAHSAAYLYVISGMHAIHIIGGLIFLTYFYWKSRTTLNDFSTSLVYFTDPIAKYQLHLFGIYWHFLGIVWLYLLLFFVAFK